MTKSDFIEPYLLLIYQPWGKRYEMKNPEGQAQSELYYSQVSRYSAESWAKTCQRVAVEFDHWPSVSELKAYLKPSPGPWQGNVYYLPPPHVDEAAEDYLPRQAYEYAKQHDITITEACRKLMPVWLQDHPAHPERERVQALLAQLETSLAPKPIRSMPTYEATSEKYEWATDAKAEGLKGHCPKCQQLEKVFVCWCQREACKNCLAKHLPDCTAGKDVQGA